VSMTIADHVYDNNWDKCADDKGKIDYEKLVKVYHNSFEEYETAAQAEIAELKELIKREVVPDVKDAEIARLQSALDVAVEGLEFCKISERNKDRLDVVEPLFLAKLLKIIDSEASEALDKIKQIRGGK
jgi:hypothetical protein